MAKSEFPVAWVIEKAMYRMQSIARSRKKNDSNYEKVWLEENNKPSIWNLWRGNTYTKIHIPESLTYPDKWSYEVQLEHCRNLLKLAKSSKQGYITLTEEDIKYLDPEDVD